MMATRFFARSISLLALSMECGAFSLAAFYDAAPFHHHVGRRRRTLTKKGPSFAIMSTNGNNNRMAAFCTLQKKQGMETSRMHMTRPDKEGHETQNNNKINNDQPNQQPNSASFFLQDLWHAADPLEIRLDATLLTCFILARFLVYDIATSTKTTPGWVLQDWIYISSAFSSAIVLSAYWTLCGVFVTQSFTEETRSSSSWRIALWTSVNVLAVTPLWLAAEQALHFGPPGMSLYTLDDIVASVVGLAATMLLAKQATAGWR